MQPVAIVIPAFNDAATLPACVRSVLTLTEHPDWNLIIVDAGSTDETPAILAALAAGPNAGRITILRLPNSTGAAHALNTALAHPAAAGRDIVRLHADVVIETPGWLASLTAPLATHPKAGVVGARLVYPDGRIQSEGRSIVTGLGFHPRHCNLRAFAADGGAGPVTEVDSVAGAVAYYRRETLQAIGGFDENYGPAWMDDDDACIAARHRGYKVFVQPAVRAIHYTRCAGPVFQAKVPGTEAPLAQLTHTLKESAAQVQSAYWEAKWGWNPFHPDTNEIRRLHGHTEICWRIGEALRYRATEEHPHVDCALVTWNSLAFLRRTLETLALTDYPADRLHVYVADNGSTDGTPAYLASLAGNYPFDLHVVTLPLNTGVAAGVNAAIMAGKSELVARLDDDIALESNWLRAFVEDLKRRPFAGCVATKTINDTPLRTLQWACPHSYPNGYNYRDETNEGQADYLARVAAIHGCCILYRRDTFKRCGFFDIRFSPTQYDDIDHNLALVHAGYEILYDGRIFVTHKISTGLDRSYAGMASASANGHKMYGKWGKDVFEIIDTAIVLSREGRYLPDDGDTSAWLAAGPSPSAFPRRAPALSPKHLRILADIYQQLALTRGVNDSLLECAHTYLKRGRQLVAKGFHMDALDVFLTTVNFFPSLPEAFVDLAETYHRLGYTEQGRSAARRGLHLAPGTTSLTELSTRAATSPAVVAPEAATAELVVTSSDALRVLMVNTFQPRLPNDDLATMEALAGALRVEGVHVDISRIARPNPAGYHLVHVWNTAFPYQTLSQINAVRVAAPRIPVLLSPLYADGREATWAAKAIGELFSPDVKPDQTEKMLAALARDVTPVSGEARPTPRNIHLYLQTNETCQQRLVERVDHLLPSSNAELQNLQRELSVKKPSTPLPHAVDAELIQGATANWFVENYGVRDFVLSVGGLDVRKNQLLLIQAMQGTGLPLVLVGHHRDSDYTELCLRHAPRGTVFIEHLEPAQLASAYKAARVYAAPSWLECRFAATVEAAIAGCSLAISRRPGEQEYFGATANLCNPGDIASIRNAVVTAHKSHPLTEARRAALSNQLAKTCDLRAVARQLAVTYRQLAATPAVAA